MVDGFRRCVVALCKGFQGIALLLGEVARDFDLQMDQQVTAVLRIDPGGTQTLHSQDVVRLGPLRDVQLALAVECLQRQLMT